MKSKTLKFRPFDESMTFTDNDVKYNGPPMTSVRFLKIDKLMRALIQEEIEKLRVSKPHFLAK